MESELYSLIAKYAAMADERSYSIYLASSCGRFKIGYSIDPRDRMLELSISSPGPVLLVDSFRCLKPVRIERIIHNYYSAHHIHREWFNLPESALIELREVFSLMRNAQNYTSVELSEMFAI